MRLIAHTLVAATLLAACALASAQTTAPASAASTAAPASAASVATPASAATTAAPAAASAAAAADDAAAKLSPADRKRMLAIEQYQHDLVTVVALRADPDYLLGAAVLSAPFKDPTQGLDFDSLSARAATGDHAAGQWLRMSLCKDQKECPNAEAFAWLKKHAADNAAVWIVALDLAARDKDAKAEREALKHAAAAKLYDDYYGKTLAGVAKATSILPPLADTMQGAHDGQPDNPDGVRMLVTLFSTESHLRPEFAPLDQLCDAADAAKHTSVKADCLKLAHTLQWGSSPLARAMGLRIAGTLDPAGNPQTDTANRNLAWQVQQYSQLLRGAFTDPSKAAHWLDAARSGGTELSLMLATLRANGIDSDAPPADAAPASSSPATP